MLCEDGQRLGWLCPGFNKQCFSKRSPVRVLKYVVGFHLVGHLVATVLHFHLPNLAKSAQLSESRLYVWKLVYFPDALPIMFTCGVVRLR